MIEWIYLLIGILLIGCVSYDLVYTTFSPHGAGFITGTVSSAIWKIFFGLSSKFNNKRLLNGAGIVTVMSVLLFWVLLLWLGNTFIYLSDPQAVLHSNTHEPADMKQRIYFTGYVLSTMGNGDYIAGTDYWRIYTAFISFSGLMMITIGITYMVPVLSAVTQRRTLSIRIAALGHSPETMLLNSWNGKDFKRLEHHFQDLAMQVGLQGQAQLAYPVLHYFHHTDKEAALLPNIAALDEAITLLLLFVPEQLRPSSQYIIPLRQATTSFLVSLTSLYLNPSNVMEPPIEIGKLQEAGVPLQQADVAQIEHLNPRRRILRAMAEHDGWEWDDISAPILNSKLDLPEML